jgi:hypothetical protein
MGEGGCVRASLLFILSPVSLYSVFFFFLSSFFFYLQTSPDYEQWQMPSLPASNPVFSPWPLLATISIYPVKFTTVTAERI